MSSDGDYASFLDKANQDTGSRNATATASPAKVTTKAVDAAVPRSLQDIERFYVSEADEPFEPVSLQWTQKSMPTEDEMGALIGVTSEISIIDNEDFDPRGEYKDIIEAVQGVGDAEPKIYRIHRGKTRAEYYVISHESKGSRLVGLKAKAVET